MATTQTPAVQKKSAVERLWLWAFLAIALIFAAIWVKSVWPGKDEGAGQRSGAGPARVTRAPAVRAMNDSTMKTVVLGTNWTELEITDGERWGCFPDGRAVVKLPGGKELPDGPGISNTVGTIRAGAKIWYRAVSGFVWMGCINALPV